jgi:hypothetical protein
MPLPSRFRTTLLVLCAVCAFSASASAAEPADTLDQRKIHDLYNGGDFEPVISVLETFINTHASYTHSDSVFIAKHLAVVYSANPQTREKGKYYMFRLLELLPSAKLVDMYVSEEVDRIFDRVREEFLARQHAFGVDTSKIDLPDRPRQGNAAISERGRAHTWLWISLAGGAALAGAGAWIWIADAGGGSHPPAEPVNVTVITPRN